MSQKAEIKASKYNVVNIATIAALYAVSFLALSVFGAISFGPIQFRASEAFGILPLFTIDAIPGLALGCMIANLYNMVFTGIGSLGLLDVVFGSLATLIAAWGTYYLRQKPLLALLVPCVVNALIIPAYLPFLLQGMGFYTIPFTSISLEDSYWFMYIFGAITVFVGEAGVMYALGLPLYKALDRAGITKYFKH